MNSNKFISKLWLVISSINIIVGISIICFTNEHSIRTILWLIFWIIISIISIIILNWNNCFFKHTWSKWEQYEEIMFLIKYGPDTKCIQPKQKRRCLNCNKIQIEDTQ